MYPFLALVWEPTRAESAAAVQQLLIGIRAAFPNYEAALSENGVIVLHNPPSGRAMRAYQLPQGLGVVLGRVFPMNRDEWHVGWAWSPSNSEATEIIRTRGQWLVRELWGGYVAFLRDPTGSNTLVIRDCSGKLPCYRLRHSQVDLFFSDPAALYALNLVPSGINFDYVCAFLCSSQMQIRDTGLEGVTELLAGDCFHRTSAGTDTEHPAWSPHSVLQRPLVNDFPTAVKSVRSTAIYCVTAWASVHDAILHSLSGGLDSTVVLACLAQSESTPTVVCVNRFGAKHAEDERRFARLAASIGQFRLLELPIISDEQVIDEALTDLPLTAKPTIPGTLGFLDVSPLYGLAGQLGADSIWTGQGGDHLFLQVSSPVGPLDYVFLRGFRLGLLKSLRDAVRLSKLNYWHLVKLLYTKDFHLTLRGLGEVPTSKQPFLTVEARSRVYREYPVHPWMAHEKPMPPGQCLQIAAASAVLNRHRPLLSAQRIHEHHPLLSQPLLELCIRIPSYVHLNAGVDRAVERAAFADLIPSDISGRLQKGQSTFSLLEAIHRSRQYVRDLLLGGILAQEGILNRASLEPYLNGQQPIELSNFFPFLSCIAAELWVRSTLNWSGRLSDLNCADAGKGSTGRVR